MSRFDDQLAYDSGMSCFHFRLNNSSRLEDKIKLLPFFVCRAFDKHFGLFFAATSILDRKIQYHEN